MKKLFTLLFFFSFLSLSWSQDHTIAVSSNIFTPSSLTVYAGQTVQWTNTGGFHNVNGSQATYSDNPESFGNGGASTDAWTYDFTFNTPGFYTYQCDPHANGGMIGNITVLNTLYPIGTVTGDSDMDGETDSVGVECSLIGVVHGVDLDGNNGISFTIIDAAGDGISVFNFDDVSDYVVTEGDEITVIGSIGSFRGLAQINPDSIIVNSTGNDLDAVTDVTALDESTESQLIRLTNVTMVDPSQWNTGGSFNLDVTDGTNTYVVRVDGDTDLSDEPTPTTAFNITGIGGQFASSTTGPFVDGYQLLPRYVADLEAIIDPCAIGTLTADSDMNGEADSVGVSTCTLTGVVHGVDLDGNAGLSFTIIDAAGNGINIFNFDDVSDYVVTEGDEVTIEGEVGSFRGLAQFEPTSIVVNSAGNDLSAVTDVTALDESTESQLIRLVNITLVDPTQWMTGGSFNLDVTDGTNTYTVRVDGDTDLSDEPVPTTAFNITGIGGQFASSTTGPFVDGYQLLPRYVGDLEVIVPATPELIITGVVDPQGANGAGPKSLELYAAVDIPDLSIYGLGSANNGLGSDGIESTFPAEAVAAGTCITVTDSSSLSSFMAFFGVNPTYLVDEGGATAINGNDAIELFKNGEVIDVFGEINGGNGTWDYTDGWAYRKPGTGPDGSTFVANNWVYSGADALQDGTFATNAEFANPYPICTYSPMAPENIVANDDPVTLDINVASNIDVLDNDATPNGVTSLSISVVSTPSGGTAVANGITDITYTPNMDFCGSDDLMYIICDANGCDSAMVMITIDCPIPAYDIGLVTTSANGASDSLGITCQLTGVVYGVDWDGNEGLSFTIIGSDGEGINVFNFDDVSSYSVLEGDEITVRGVIGQFRGLTELIPDSIMLNSTGNDLVTPTDVTSLGEDTESQLIRFTNVTLVDPTQWATGMGSGFNVDITDGTNTFAMRIDNEVDLFNAAPPTGVLNITGIGGQFASSNDAPYVDGYQIAPRYAADIESVINTNDLELGSKIKFMPNPTRDILQINSEIQLDQIRITNILGQQVLELQQPNLSETVNVNNWQSGVYIISFISNDQIYTSQLVKQ